MATFYTQSNIKVDLILDGCTISSYIIFMKREEVVAVLDDHGIRRSVQRVEFAQVLFSRKWHCTAAALSDEVNQIYPLVSRATVFNTIRLFEEKGLLKRLEFSPGEAIFDSNLEPHHHLVDKSNGEVHDIALPAHVQEMLTSALADEARKQGIAFNGSLDIKVTGFLK